MSTKIEIHLKDLAPIKEFYTNKAAELRRLIESTNSELEDVIKVIRYLDNEIAHTQELPAQLHIDKSRTSWVFPKSHKVEGLPGYNTKLTWERKAIYFIELSGQPLTTSEIADMIVLAEPGLDRKKVISSLSATLSQKIWPNGVFDRAVNENGEYAHTVNHKKEEVLDIFK